MRSARNHSQAGGFRTVAFGTALGLVLAGCATPGEHLEDRRADVETRITAQGLGSEPAIETARAELEAAVAQEGADVAIDGVELRAAVVHEKDEKLQTLARLPLRNPLELREQRKARRAESEVALARLEEVTLEQRVAGCLPSLQHQVRTEQQQIYESYAERHRALLDWNREMREAGSTDEVSARRFELSANVKLTTRDPSALPELAPLASSVGAVGAVGSVGVLDVLPAPEPGAPSLRADPDVLQQELLRHQPSIAVHRARGRQFAALARSETMKRIPSVRFVDFGYEPVAYPGDERALEARISFEIPFGREASANSRRYQALARAEKSGERALLDIRRAEATQALSEVNAFRRRAEHWVALLAQADASESIADGWRRDRLANPSQISGLLESVYEARLAVLEASRRAGRAGCEVVAATGVPVSEWPQ